MSELHAASIVVNNYNYGRFLRDAIDSALRQTYPNTEVIVVDDGSTDDSREVIAGYGSQIISVLKENGGQGSAFNAGFALSRGDVIIFLDADDMLLPSAVEKAIQQFHDLDVVKVHWPLLEIDREGRKTGRIIPGHMLPEGDLRNVIIRDGPYSYISPPTTGNAWSRRFLKKVLPMDESQFRVSADAYLIMLALIFGTIRRILDPQGYYRRHGGNLFASKSELEMNRSLLEKYDYRCLVLTTYLRGLGVNIDSGYWKGRSAYYTWLHWQQIAIEEIRELIPRHETFILVDQDTWGERWGDSEVAPRRHVLPFLEREGQYWGPPPDDATAIREFERLRHAGARFMVFAWQAFWWFDYYVELHRHLRSNFRCLLENERLVAFDLRP